jgi:hypothetical protein
MPTVPKRFRGRGIDLYGTNNGTQTVGTDTANSGPNIINP